MSFKLYCECCKKKTLEMVICSTFSHLADDGWWKLLLSYTLSAPHDEPFSYYSHISSSGYQIHGRRGWVMAVIRLESFFLNPCSSTFWGPLRTLCSPLSRVCPEWKINNTPHDGSEFNKDSNLEECHVCFPALGVFFFFFLPSNSTQGYLRGLKAHSSATAEHTRPLFTLCTTDLYIRCKQTSCGLMYI